MPPRAAARNVLVIAEAGLSNKLRVVLSYLDVARRRGQQLVVFWRHFTGVRRHLCGAIQTARRRPISARAASKFANRAARCLRHAPGAPVHRTRVGHVRTIAAAAVDISARRRAQLKEFDGAEYCAIHVRRTDHAELFGERSPCRDVDFYAFCDRHDPLPIFLATDNAATQAAFAARYGARLRALTPMRPRRSRRHAPGSRRGRARGTPPLPTPSPISRRAPRQKFSRAPSCRASATRSCTSAALAASKTKTTNIVSASSAGNSRTTPTTACPTAYLAFLKIRS